MDIYAYMKTQVRKYIDGKCKTDSWNAFRDNYLIKSRTYVIRRARLLVSMFWCGKLVPEDRSNINASDRLRLRRSITINSLAHIFISAARDKHVYGVYK